MLPGHPSSHFGALLDAFAVRVYDCLGPSEKGLRLEAGKGAERERTSASEYLHRSSGHMTLDSGPIFLHFGNLI